MLEYTHFRDFTVRLKYTANAAGDTPPVFTATVSAVDLAGAEREAATLVVILHGLVEVIGVTEGAVHHPRP